nr:DUF247 domain protein [Ipomoea trifida]
MDYSDLVDRRKDGSNLTWTKRETSAAFEALMALKIPKKEDIVYTNLIIKNYPLTIEGVRTCIKDNDLDETNIKDVAYASIIVALVETNMIPKTSDVDYAPTNTKPNANSVVTEKIVNRRKEHAALTVRATMFLMAQGMNQENLSWFKSYCNVYGPYITERRFVELCKLIMTTDAIQYVFNTMTIGELYAQNKVFLHRLVRLSAPELVRKALRMIVGTDLMKMIDPRAVLKYKMFSKAGLAAQIAAGPLKCFCKGDKSPLECSPLPKDMPLVELQPIDAPYDAELLRQTKIILEEFNIEHGKWFQGDKAMAGATLKDTYFRDKLRAIKAVQADRIKAMNGTDAVGIMRVGDWENARSGAVIANLASDWSETPGV